MTSEDKMTVIFTAKELFQQINDRLGSIVESLETKASQEDVRALTGRVDNLEDKSRETEVIAAALLADKNHRFTTKEKVLGFAFALLTLALNVMALGPDVIHL